MIVRGQAIAEVNGRREYGVKPLQGKLRHFVVRLTSPDNPFAPHKHDGSELWYILEGEAIVALDGDESVVEAGDLILLSPWTTHGLRTETSVRWICLG
jgi:mannose-6-phosphate isomerase-like protein (cupin superfamily)